MKCVLSYGKVREIKRVSEAEAEKLVRSKKWTYVAKKEWKAQTLAEVLEKAAD